MRSSDSSPASHGNATASGARVTLSPYVNELFPAWEELLSARDVARLTRRPHWMLMSLALLGRFPRKHRFRGRPVGWLRGDVLAWIARVPTRPASCRALCAARRPRSPCSGRSGRPL